MKATRQIQKGASGIGNIILLAILAFSIYVGVQYVPQWLEFRTYQSILNSMENQHQSTPVISTRDAQQKIESLLNINEMNGNMDKFKIRQNGNSVVITVDYQHDLNLLYKDKPMHYQDSITLRQN